MSKRCLARGSKGPCKRLIRDDEKRCRFHGGAAAQVKRAADERALVAAVQRDVPTAGRDPRLILLDTVQKLDELVQRDPTDVDRLVMLIKMAKQVCDAGVAERLAQQAQRDLEAEGRYVVRALTAALDQVADLLPVAEIDRAAWYRWLCGVALADLAGAPLPERPTRPPETAVEPLRGAPVAQTMALPAAEATGDLADEALDAELVALRAEADRLRGGRP